MDDGLSDLVADAAHRVEGVHGALKDEGDATPAIGAHLGFAEAQQVGAVVNDLATRDAPGLGQQAQQGQHGGRLAAAALADEGQRTTALQGEAD